MENPPGDLGVLRLKEKLQRVGGGNLGILQLKEEGK